MPRTPTDKLLLVYLALYGAVSGWSASFFPSYSWPGGDEATYYTYAEHPWTLQSELFEGFAPKEMVSPFNLRGFLTPFAIVFKLFGFTVVGARLLLIAYGLALLWVTYKIMKPLAGEWLAVAFTIVLSLAPIFVTQTHVVRPEILFTLGLTTWLWLLFRREEPLSRLYAAGLGLLAASLIWVHYNAVVFWPILGAVLLVYERRRLSVARWASFVAGGALFGVVFVALNLVPALDTLRELGVVPQTFVSSNKMPLLSGEIGRSSEKIAKMVNDWLSGQLPNEVWVELGFASINTSWVTLVFVAIPLLGVWGEKRPAWWALATFVVLSCLAQWLLVPNVRDDHMLYILPPLFIMAGATVARLNESAREIVALAVLIAGVTIFGFGDFLILRAWHKVAQANRPTEQTLSNLVDLLGQRPDVTVLGPQEFHQATYGVRFRTFHALIDSKSLQDTLQAMQPNVVLMTPRTRDLIPKFILAPAFISSDEAKRAMERLIDERVLVRRQDNRIVIDYSKLRKVIDESLKAEGYELVQRMPWNGESGGVDIWIRTDDFKQLKARTPAPGNPAQVP